VWYYELGKDNSYLLLAFQRRHNLNIIMG